MTEFQKKRLEHFIKSAGTYGWVQLSKGDIHWMKLLLEMNEKYTYDG